uniref:Nudix hydrolase 17 n=4 Tax=Cercopithecinae TaxID=9528 RepID=A0A2K5P562_CERAT|nr:unnamed protein product [Macaca fascicularis]
MLVRMWKKESPAWYTIGNVNWYSHHGRLQRFLKKLKIDLYAPAVPLLATPFLPFCGPGRAAQGSWG